jgi:glutaredoxin 3
VSDALSFAGLLELGFQLGDELAFWHMPPADVLDHFLQAWIDDLDDLDGEARALLDEQAGQEKTDVAAADNDDTARQEFEQVTNAAPTVPQIVIDGKPIGGFSELTELHMDGELDHLTTTE